MQYLDTLDDLISAVFLLGERLRRLFLFLLVFGLSLPLQVGAVLLALRHPPLACAAATLMAVTLMYRSATAPRALHPHI